MLGGREGFGDVDGAGADLSAAGRGVATDAHDQISSESNATRPGGFSSMLGLLIRVHLPGHGR